MRHLVLFEEQSCQISSRSNLKRPGFSEERPQQQQQQQQQYKWRYGISS